MAYHINYVFVFAFVAFVALPPLGTEAFRITTCTSRSESEQRSLHVQSPLFVSTLTKDVIEQHNEHADPLFRVPDSLLSPEQLVMRDEQLPKESSFPLATDTTASFDYGSFAKEFPLMNNMMIASTKAALADLFAQTAIAHVGLDGVNWQRTFLFFLFGAFYQGGFQYLYQVNVFSKIFDNVEKFTSQPWADKLRDGPGLKSLATQVALDLTIMSSVYLPVYYSFKASIFSDVMDPTAWLQDGLSSYRAHFGRDEVDLLRVWLPADLLCFSAPLILRLPLRQVISLFYTTYLSAASFGGH